MDKTKISYFMLFVIAVSASILTQSFLTFIFCICVMGAVLLIAKLIKMSKEKKPYKFSEIIDKEKTLDNYLYNLGYKKFQISCDEISKLAFPVIPQFLYNPVIYYHSFQKGGLKQPTSKNDFGYSFTAALTSIIGAST